MQKKETIKNKNLESKVWKVNNVQTASAATEI